MAIAALIGNSLTEGVVKQCRKYLAAIRVDGKYIRIGLFHTPQEAHAAYCEKGKELFGEFFCAG